MASKIQIYVCISLLNLMGLMRFANGLGKVMFAVNAGGNEHVDIYGTHYQKDYHTEGIASDYGMRLDAISRVDSRDQVLYRTERYSMETFGYDIPIKEDGNYVLVLKFCEVYFRTYGMKIFDVVLNSKYFVVAELDIFAAVGYGVAHDELIPFTISKKGTRLTYDGQESEVKNGKVKVEFVKGSQDNPKINALYVMKGTLDDVPKLDPMQQLAERDDIPYGEMEDDEDFIIENTHDIYNNDFLFDSRDVHKSRSGPMHRDPWEDESHYTVYFPLYGSVAISICAIVFIKIITKN